MQIVAGFRPEITCILFHASGQLGVSFGMAAYGSGMSYWLMKRHSRYGWTVPTAGIVAHTAGATTGLAHR